MSAIRPIAFYLPQFHPTPENDEWWGKGFTEWRNVVKVLPRFNGHYQPHLPADLGFYDLRLMETRQSQAELAKDHGIYGFCYYHYWFSGRRLLNRPFDEVLSSQQPDFPFCLCWANHNWTRRWDGLEQDMLVRQEYSFDDDLEHIRWLAKAFSDKRYIKVGGKPLFLIFCSSQIPDSRSTLDIWRTEALRLGIGELFICAVESPVTPMPDIVGGGYDAAIEFQPRWHDAPLNLKRDRYWNWARKLGLSSLAFRDNHIWDYREFAERMMSLDDPTYLRFRCVMPSWDNSARRENEAFIVDISTPDVYERWLRSVAEKSLTEPDLEGLMFINAWNEWAEGNHLEPCQKWGRAYLDATQRVVRSLNSITPFNAKDEHNNNNLQPSRAFTARG